MKSRTPLVFLGVVLALAAAPPFPGSAELETVVDPLCARALADTGAPGLAVAIVKDGAVLLSKGYGFADVARGARVDSRTRFRVGSVSKTVTAIAVLQLVEQGALAVGEDVNRYLTDLRVPDAFGAPITAHALLTHTAGLEDRLVRTAAADRSALLPLGAYLARELPQRVLPPGDTVLYSNHGYALLGHLVEERTRRPFAQYAQDRIFRPLGMQDTTFGDPEEGSAPLAVGYEIRGRTPRAVPDVFLQIGPAAGLVSSANDMARLLLALLGGGRVGDARILSEGSIEEMQTTQFVPREGALGVCYGSFESAYFNRRQLYHPGGVRGYGALLYLFPEERLGVFVADNGDDAELGWRIVDPLLERYYPAAPPERAPSRGAPSALEALEGTYRPVKYARSTLEKIALLRGAEVPVSARADGTLAIGGTPFFEIAPRVFQQLRGFERAAFREDGFGRVRHLYVGWEAFERVPPLERAAVQRPLLALFLVAFTWGLLLKPETASAPLPRHVRLAYAVARAVALSNLVFLVGLAALFLVVRPGTIWTGWPRALPVLLAIPLLGCALTLALFALAWPVLRGAELTRAAKLRLALLGCAAAGFVPFLAHWNLLGFRL